MARSKFNWLIVFEGGVTQFAKAQTIWQIIDSGELIEDSDSIINITKLESCWDDNSYSNTQNLIDIQFQD
jgi:hypothetical protein